MLLGALGRGGQTTDKLNRGGNMFASGGAGTYGLYQGASDNGAVRQLRDLPDLLRSANAEAHR
jgi:hypothetical protein